MPSSHPSQLTGIVELITLTHPTSVLDIGIGFGKYGFLAREYLELWDGRERYDDWTVRIDGIEAYADYVTPAQEFVYNEIYVGNAVKVLPTLTGRYDLILLIDVLEHFSQEEGAQILRSCEDKGRNVIVSVPKVLSPQGAAFGNPYETHRFHWMKKHFKEKKDHFFVPDTRSLICFYGEDGGRVRRSFRRCQRDHLFAQIPGASTLVRRIRRLHQAIWPAHLARM